MSEVYKNFKSGEKKITTATTHKQWEVTKANSGSLQIKEFDGYFVSGTFNPQDTLQGSVTDETLSTSSGSSYYKKLVYDGIAHLYYSGNDNPYDVFCNDNPDSQIRELNGSVKVISIPSTIFGERIKPGSVRIVNASGTPFSLYDDSLGNLYDNTDTHGRDARQKMPQSDFYMGLWDGYVNELNKTIKSCSLQSEATFVSNPKAFNVQFVDSKHGRGVHFLGTSSFKDNYGSVDQPHDNSLIEVRDSKDQTLDYSNDMTNFFSFWLKAPVNQIYSASWYGPWKNDSDSVNSRLTKLHTTNVIATKAQWFGNPTPWEIVIHNGMDIGSGDTNAHKGKLQFNIGSQASDGGMNRIKTTGLVNTNTWKHISIAVHPSLVQIYIDGALDTSQAISLGENPMMKTNSNIFFGGRPYGYKGKYYNTGSGKWHNTKDNKNIIKPFNGSIDEFRIYTMPSESLLPAQTIGTNTTALQLAKDSYESVNASNFVGNVMYDHGLITITTPSSSTSIKKKYHNLDSNFNLQFQGSHKVKEHLYICNILDGEYNATYNPTARVNTDDRNDNLQAYTTHSEFNPYMTSIGLYNENYDLVAVGKLAQPIKNQDDYDNTIQVRFDTTI